MLQGGLEVGAATTLADLILTLQGGEEGAGSAWRHMAAHLKRIAGARLSDTSTLTFSFCIALAILWLQPYHMSGHPCMLGLAGTHVRNAATVGGNLVLARDRRLESDLATVLMGAGAAVEFVPLLSCADDSKAK